MSLIHLRLFSANSFKKQPTSTVSSKSPTRPSPSLANSNTLYRAQPVILNGHTLSITQIAAVAQHDAQVILDSSDSVRAKVDASRELLVGKLAKGNSIYGISTGFGGSGQYSSLFFAIWPTRAHSHCHFERIFTNSGYENERPSLTRPCSPPTPTSRCPALLN